MRHPLHPMLVHFPVACWSLGTLGDFASLHFGEPAWFLSGSLIAIGVVMALAAMAAGMIELTQVPDGGSAMRDAYLHMGLMLLAFGLYLTSALLRIDEARLGAPGVIALVTSASGFLALMAGGYMGGRLVYGHGIGSGRRPPQEESK